MSKKILVGGTVVVWALMTACSASPNGERDVRSSEAESEAEAESANTDPTSASCPLGSKDGKCLALTPSNLPADICNTPGTKDFTGGRLPEECDALIPQNGGPDICLYKFANVSGNIENSYYYEITAIVATNSMQLGSYTVPRAFNQRTGVSGWGATGEAPCGGSGGGYGTPGGGPGGGPSYGSETAIPLLPGAGGGQSVGYGGTGGVPFGYGGSAVQFVSCGALQIAGPIIADGEEGAYSLGGGNGVGGAGGGSGGTILIEAASVSATSSSTLRANGGKGGFGWGHAGGSGGTADSPPGPATCGGWDPETEERTTGGGGGGAVGRIRINVRAGTQPELLGSMSPLPSIGAVATH